MVNMVTFGVITSIFLAATFYLGWCGYKGTRDNSEFLLGRNKTSPVIIALSYGATFVSASAIVGFGGMSAKYGLSMIWLTVLCIVVGTLIAFMVFGKRMRRIGKEMGAFTFSDFLGKRFRSPGIRTVSALIIIIGMPIYCAAVLLGGANFVTATTGINKDMVLLGLSLIVALYVTYGGVIAVMYNDALQATIMFVGMIIISVFTFYELGGVVDANTALGMLWDAKIASGDEVMQALAANGMTGWASFPEFGSNVWMTVVTTLLLGVGIGALAQPQLAVRFMSAKDEKTLNRSLGIGAVFILVILGSAFTFGALSNVYFADQHGGLAAIEYIPNVDMIIPTFVNELFVNVTFGDIFISIFMLAILCASISTMSALLHTMGVSVGYDLWSRIRKESLTVGSDMVRSMRSNRISTLVMMIAVVIVAYCMPSNIIAKATTIFMGLTAATLLSAYAHGLFSKRPNTTAAKCSIVVGALTWTLWAFFVEYSTSKLGLCRMIFGVDSLTSGILGYVDPLVVALPLSAITLIAVCLLRPTEETTGVGLTQEV
ncbi:MAG: sodium:solute symporter family protein [Candidatus Methanomethylophilaceae archaeon]